MRPTTRFPFVAALTSLLLFGAQGRAQTRHLFFDPHFVRDGGATMLKVNPPARQEIVIRPDKPWEKFMITFYLTVFEEGEKLRMWYVCRDADNVANVAYAESTDGVNWMKPALGVVDYHGSRENNLVGIGSLEGNVFRDPHAATPDERYVYVSTVFKGGGVCRFTSPDGYRWKRDERPLLPFEADSQNVTFWDERLQKYVLFFRGWTPKEPRGHERKVVRLETTDLRTPFDLKPSGKGATYVHQGRDPFIVDEALTVITCDERDPDHTDVYTNAIQRYPLAPRWYVGFPSLYHHPTKDTIRSDGRTEGHFISSTDGISWNRYAREPYTRPGLAGSENGNMVYMGVGLVMHGDEIWQYGTGFRTTHNDFEGRKERTDGVILRYVQRVDGFVSLDFPSTTTRAVTQPITVEGSNLCLNVDTGAIGEMRIGLLDAEGREIPGFAASTCDAIRINSTHAVVAWKGTPNLAELRGNQVQVVISGSRAKLFSLRFE